MDIVSWYLLVSLLPSLGEAVSSWMGCAEVCKVCIWFLAILLGSVIQGVIHIITEDGMGWDGTCLSA